MRSLFETLPSVIKKNKYNGSFQKTKLIWFLLENGNKRMCVKSFLLAKLVLKNK